LRLTYMRPLPIKHDLKAVPWDAATSRVELIIYFYSLGADSLQ
jgi:hypothetical protein